MFIINLFVTAWEKYFFLNQNEDSNCYFFFNVMVHGIFFFHTNMGGEGFGVNLSTPTL